MKKTSELRFRRTMRADLPLIQRWLRAPHVARFWNHDTDDAAIERDFGGSIEGAEPSEDFIVEESRRAIGFIQRSEILDYPGGHRELIELVSVPDRSLTIDYFIGETEALGRGLGSELLRRFTEICWRGCPQAPEIIVPISASNPASWSALESAGYVRFATGWLTPDNPIDDGQHHIYRCLRPKPPPAR